MGTIYRLHSESEFDATTKVIGAGQSLSFDNASAISGYSGDVKAVIANNNPVYARGLFSNVTTPYCFYRYYYDVSSLSTLTTGQSIYFTYLVGSSGNSNSTVGLLYSGGTTKIYHIVRNDSLATTGAVSTLVTSGMIEVRLYKSSAPATADGRQELYIDGVLVSTIGSKVLYDIFEYKEIRVGGNSISGVTGSLYIGKVSITDDGTPIGPYVPHNVQTFNQLRRRRRLS